MQHSFTHHPVKITPRSAVDAAGIVCTSEPGWTVAGSTLEFELPGVNELTDEQRQILDLFAEYKLTGRERFPGILAALTATQNLRTAQAALMGSMIESAQTTGDPTSGLILLVAQMVNDSLNEFREPVSFEDVIAAARVRLSS